MSSSAATWHRFLLSHPSYPLLPYTTNLAALCAAVEGPGFGRASYWIKEPCAWFEVVLLVPWKS